MDITNRKSKVKYIHGNYPGYYSYRHESMDPDQTYDARLKELSDRFKMIPESSNCLSDIVGSKNCLDLGCNAGLVTIDVALYFHPSWIIGVDLDPELIRKARNNLAKLPTTKSNVRFSCDNILDYLHCPMNYDVIFCLSVTKWIHLNSGDEGIVSLFEKIKQALKVGGIFILEPQPFPSYARRKNLSNVITGICYDKIIIFCF